MYQRKVEHFATRLLQSHYEIAKFDTKVYL
jgi:hypothetical protein